MLNEAGLPARQAIKIRVSNDRLGGLLDAYPVASFIKSMVDPFIMVMVLYAQAAYCQLLASGPLLLIAILAFMAGVMLLDNTYLLMAESRDQSLGVIRFAMTWALMSMLIEAVCKLAGWRFPDRFILSWLMISPLGILLTHFGFRCFFLVSPGYRGAMRRVLIIGANEAGQILAERIRSEAPLRQTFIGYVDDRDVARLSLKRPDEVLGGLSSLLDLIAQHRIDRIYVSLPMARQARIVALLDTLQDSTVSVYFVPDMTLCELMQARLDHVYGIPVLGVRESPFIGLLGPIKRAEDLILTLGILALIWPLMLIIALAVKLTSPGPILFVQRRYGVDGQSIGVYKFRSMTVMENGEQIRQAQKDDQRLTRIGAFLRKTSLDELPQFFNVLKGQMSIVGPRPHANAHNELYRRLIRGYMLRHKVKPGITGWAQVNGQRGETVMVEQMQRRIEMDLEYIRNWSIGLDLRIIFRTIVVMFRDQNAY